MVYFAFTLVQLFQQGTVQRLLFGKETFQCIDICLLYTSDAADE